MLEQLKYKNHVNEVFEFGKDGIFVNTNDMHDYEWNVTKKNNKIASLDYAVTKRKLPIIIICDTEEKGFAARNKLLEITEKDVLAMQHGRIIIGDYYFKCYVTKSEKKNYLTSRRYMELTLTLTTDFPYWIKESSLTFGAAKEEEITNTSGFLDYLFEYPFDYSNRTINRTLDNTGFVASNFRMIIYGVCSNPTINIANHTYKVNCTVGEGEYLTIDSSSKKIILTANDGTQTNVFKNRDKDSYIFEKIPVGSNAVTWDGDFGFDIILLEERSEPKWI